MYTFDLMKADILIRLAEVASKITEGVSVPTSTRLQEVRAGALEDARKLVNSAKPTPATEGE